MNAPIYYVDRQVKWITVIAFLIWPSTSMQTLPDLPVELRPRGTAIDNTCQRRYSTADHKHYHETLM
ncbi:MAG TPA: hypothetical protein VL995_10315 [Cellvibrio sp.]|nr:hypothetical protein [Cellvibrio sp.]